MMPNLLLVPLDARPCTLRFPADLAASAGAMLRTPPPEILGDLQKPADPDALRDWLQEYAPQADALVLALDTLAYGGLIPSRRHMLPLAKLQERLQSLRQLKERFPRLALYGFSVTMRLSNSNDATEEKSYWAQFGKLLYRHSFHQDRFDVLGDAADREIAAEARAEIPPEILEDYRESRARNFAINRMLVDWTAEGILDLLALTQDDTSPFGFNVREQRQLVSDVQARGLEDRVLIYPGADEVAAVLVARHLNAAHGKQPAFQLRTSTPDGGQIIAMYEDRPLCQTASGQIKAVGGLLVETAQEADCLLMLNTPACGQGDLALRLHLDLPDTPPRDLAAFARELQLHSKGGAQPPAALADVAYANGADAALLACFEDYPQLAAFAAWNTAGNTLGTVVAQASCMLIGRELGDLAARAAALAAQEGFLLDRMADDILYQAYLRPELQLELRAGRPLAAIESELPGRLGKLWQLHFPRVPIAGIEASLPWGRLFEADVRVIPAKTPLGS